MPADLLQVREGRLLPLEQRAHAPEGRPLELLAPVQRVACREKKGTTQDKKKDTREKDKQKKETRRRQAGGGGQKGKRTKKSGAYGMRRCFRC